MYKDAGAGRYLTSEREMGPAAGLWKLLELALRRVQLDPAETRSL